MTGNRKPTIQEFGYRVPRFHADFHFQLQVSDPQPRLVDACCIDISSDGLAAKMAESLPVGTCAILMLALPGHRDTLRISARVSHQQRENHGFVFRFGSQRERESIQKYIASLRRTVALHRPATQ